MGEGKSLLNDPRRIESHQGCTHCGGRCGTKGTKKSKIKRYKKHRESPNELYPEFCDNEVAIQFTILPTDFLKIVNSGDAGLVCSKYDF